MRWAKRCKEWKRTGKRRNGETAKSSPFAHSPFADSLLFGIVQGAAFHDLRQQSAQAIVDLDF